MYGSGSPTSTKKRRQEQLEHATKKRRTGERNAKPSKPAKPITKATKSSPPYAAVKTDRDEASADFYVIPRKSQKVARKPAPSKESDDEWWDEPDDSFDSGSGDLKRAPPKSISSSPPAERQKKPFSSSSSLSGGDDKPSREENYNLIWHDKFSRLKAFHAEHGHCTVPKNYDSELYYFTVNQKRANKVRKLASERLELLRTLDFRFTVSTPDSNSVTKGQSVKRKPKTPPKVPASSKGAQGATDERWHKMFNRLKGFRTQHGHCDVPPDYAPDPLLASWVQSNKDCWSENNSSLTQERQQLLRSIGFMRDGAVSESSVARRSRPATRQPTAPQRNSDAEQKWHYKFGLLQEYHKKHGNCKVRFSDISNRKLYNWVERQKGNNRDGKLRSDRKALLDSLGFDYHMPISMANGGNDTDDSDGVDEQQPESKGARNQRNDKCWLEMFGKLQVYHKKNGHANVPWNYSADSKLANWVKKQRQEKRTGKLPADRMVSLQSLDFSFVPDGTATNKSTKAVAGESAEAKAVWFELFGSLKQFVRLAGHSYPTEERLAHWVNWQRLAKSLGEMPADRRAMLDSINFSWTNTPSNVEQNDSNEDELSEEIYVIKGESLFYGRFKHIPDKVQLIQKYVPEYRSVYDNKDDVVDVPAGWGRQQES